MNYPTKPCGSCGRPMIWAVSEKGRPMPLDAEPTPRGTIRLVDRGRKAPLAQVVKAIDRAPAPQPGQASIETLLMDAYVEDMGAAGEPQVLLFTSHFATCPNATQHRQRAARAREAQSRGLTS